tara:strand:+ start:2385 stop:3719 length:1335 start_codon:yes stop_codon:yes gene_type:complete
MSYKEEIDKVNNVGLFYKGYDIIALSQVFLFENKLGRYGWGMSQIIKKLSLDNLVKFYLYLISPKKEINLSSLECVFVNDIYNMSMVSNSRALQKVFDKNKIIEVVCDKRIYRKNDIYLYKFSNFLSTIIDIFKVTILVFKNWEKVKEIAKLFNVNMIMLLLNVWDSLFVINCVERFFNKMSNVKSVVLNSDVHKTSRIFVFYCKKHKIKNYVLQHGAPVLDYGYLPVYADKMFNWGKLSFDWFLDKGTDINKLQITGTPKMDNIVLDKKSLENSLESLNVLVIMNPIGEVLSRDFLQIINDATKEIKVNLSIKLHPSSEHYGHLPKLIFNNCPYKLFRLEDTHELIRKSDVVVSTTSTVGAETIALYKPLIQIKLEEINTKLAYEDYDCCISAGNHIELLEILKDEKLLYSKFSNYDKFISDFFYILDGKSSERMKDAIAYEE